MNFNNFVFPEEKSSIKKSFTPPVGKTRIRVLNGANYFPMIVAYKGIKGKGDTFKSCFKCETILDEEGRIEVVPFTDKELITTGFIKDEIKLVFILAIYDYTSNTVKQWDITQSSIRNKIKNTITEWPEGLSTFDLVIDRQGEGKETRYEITLSRESQLSSEIVSIIEKERDQIDFNEAKNSGWIFKKGTK
jgi:hypothetical protein